MGMLAILIVISIVWTQLEPSRRKSHSVEITVLNESQQPIEGAVVDYSEFEVVPIIPLMPFGPARTIDNKKSVTTNADGKAHIDVKYHTTVAYRVSRAGVKLQVNYSETTDSYDGQTRRSFPEQLPQWNVGQGLPDRHWESTVVVRP